MLIMCAAVLYSYILCTKALFYAFWHCLYLYGNDFVIMTFCRISKAAVWCTLFYVHHDTYTVYTIYTPLWCQYYYCLFA